ncbi:MAG: pilus assembly PilX N-terminal domain-containing protein [Phycisphaerales bacterium]|jgi:Tfp pilus assembly protein PilX
MKSSKRTCHRHRGAALIISMIFVVIFAALAVSLATLSGTNVQIAGNQHKVNSAFAAAQSGLECAKRIAATAENLGSTFSKTLTETQADAAWSTFCDHVEATMLDGKSPAVKTTEEVITQPLSFDSTDTTFRIRFYRPNPFTIKVESMGAKGQITRKISMDMNIQRDAHVLQYAIASRGRIWLVGDSTIHGDIFSTWDLSNSELDEIAANPSLLSTKSAPYHSPLQLGADSEVLGEINTCWSKEQIEPRDWQLETLDEYGNPIYDEYGNKVIGEDDAIQGYCEGINYEEPPEDIPGMDISDYDTSIYEDYAEDDIYYSSSPQQEYCSDAELQELPAINGTKYRWECFPHDADNYTTGSSNTLKRYIYKDQAFNDVTLPSNKNALFINCTFDGVLYVDCDQTSSWNTATNNVRFDNCTFNGTIVSNTPQYFNWQKNCLYFTGSATFQNETDTDATILAPHFNVNLGNTNPVSGDENVLTGAIVGGIVDVRGNAEVFGTIISMADTSSYTSGYVTNIGATLDDGGSETTQPGDVGTIEITPDLENSLPDGIISPIVVKPLQDTYSEGV